MTQEEKQLLLKDLCARLPYGVKIHAEFNGEAYDEDLQIVNKSAMLGDYGPVPVVNPIENDINDGFELTNVKPYLRPMSSMTEEEREELKQLSDEYLEDWTNAQTPIDKWKLDAKISYNRSVFYNSHHLDWNGLIDKGLALESPEGMYIN